MTLFLIIVGVLMLIQAVFVIVVYNRITRYTKNVEEAWGNVIVALEKRHALIPRLFSAAKLSANYEQYLQSSLAEARSGRIKGTAGAEQQLEKSLFMVFEANPDIKADKNFKELFDGLVAAENDIQANRLVYNRAVAVYRRGIKLFPDRIVAYGFGFAPVDFFELELAPKELLPETQITT